MNEARLTDSPWFWTAVFAFVGLVWLAAFGPKYARRQEMIERRYEARLEIARRHAAGQLARESAARPARPGEPLDDQAAGREPGEDVAAAPHELLIPLEPLAFVLACVLEVAVWRLLAAGVAGETATPSPSPTPPTRGVAAPHEI
jgi:hypothetical protein